MMNSSGAGNKTSNMSNAYQQLQYIEHDECVHVQLLQQAITAMGQKPVLPCTYNFTINSTQQFLQLASQLEGVGVSGLIGAAGSIGSIHPQQFQTAAASILASEAYHQAILRQAAGEPPNPNPFGTPLGINATYSIARRYIQSCPENNTALPLTIYPQLAVSTGNATLNATRQNASITLTPANGPAALDGTVYATYLSGLRIIPVPVTRVNPGNAVTAAVPPGVSGQTYVFLTNDNSGNVTDPKVIAGPAMIEVPPGQPASNCSSRSALMSKRGTSLWH